MVEKKIITRKQMQDIMSLLEAKALKDTEDVNQKEIDDEKKKAQAIQKIADYAKKTGISNQLIEFMKDEFGEELGIIKQQGTMGKVWDAGKKLYKKAMAEEVRQIFTAIIQEERNDRVELIRQQDQIRLGRTRK